MAKRAKIEISIRALTQRINRKLAEGGQILRTPRGNRIHKTDTDYFIVDIKLNAIHARSINIETLGRKLGPSRNGKHSPTNRRMQCLYAGELGQPVRVSKRKAGLSTTPIRNGERHIQTFDRKKDADDCHASIKVDVGEGCSYAAQQEPNHCSGCRELDQVCQIGKA